MLSYRMSTGVEGSKTTGLYKRPGGSHPDLSRLWQYEAPNEGLTPPEHVIRVFRSDQSFCYLPIHHSTTAREVIMLALNEFRIDEPSE